MDDIRNQARQIGANRTMAKAQKDIAQSHEDNQSLLEALVEQVNALEQRVAILEGQEPAGQAGE
jgi:polyhydroxyalkanoate synthesis regulator phasin